MMSVSGKQSKAKALNRSVGRAVNVLHLLRLFAFLNHIYIYIYIYILKL